MRAGIGAVTAAALLAFTGVAAAGLIRAGSGISNQAYHGSDGAGAVSFSIFFLVDNGKLTSPGDLTDLTFANKCAKHGSSVAARIVVAHNNAFHYSGDGFTLSGSLAPAHGWKATGTVRVRTGRCDSGTLHFTATTPALTSGPSPGAGSGTSGPSGPTGSP